MMTSSTLTWLFNSRNPFHWPILCFTSHVEFFITHGLPWQSHLLTTRISICWWLPNLYLQPRCLFWVRIGYNTFLLIFNYPIGILTTDTKLNISSSLLNLLLLLLSLFQGIKPWSHTIFQVKNPSSYIWFPPFLNLPFWQVNIIPININF